MEAAGLDNDTRGWIMCIVSGIACVLGASIVCVDVVVRQFPGGRDFRIQDSSVFLASSLSLSFGVMLFSALYSMLPSSRQYLEQAGFSNQAAGVILMSGFVAGFLGIQAISRILHRFMPSHVVDCDHSHRDNALEGGLGRPCSHNSRRMSRSGSLKRRDSVRHAVENGHEHGAAAAPAMAAVASAITTTSSCEDDRLNETTPLLRCSEEHLDGLADPHSRTGTAAASAPDLAHPHARARGATASGAARTAAAGPDRRPSMFEVQKRVLSFVKDTMNDCTEGDPCYGYSDPCGRECFKHLNNRVPSMHRRATAGAVSFLRTTTGPLHDDVDVVVNDDDDGDDDDDDDDDDDGNFRISHVHPRDAGPDLVPCCHDPSCSSASSEDILSDGNGTEDDGNDGKKRGGRNAPVRPGPAARDRLPHSPPPHHDHPRVHAHVHRRFSHSPAAARNPPDLGQHHHHVPTNAFMAIGLQTSIAIALHKFPEGFITYATNHANPALGFTVFMALFVHNISEGFAMALPLYMALGSRARAMAWAALLGGLSQPMGAALAVLWFRLARGSHLAPSPVFYAVLFALTAGIMASVALQLFVESLRLDHNRNLCIFFGFLGMALLGFSGALVGGGDHGH